MDLKEMLIQKNTEFDMFKQDLWDKKDDHGISYEEFRDIDRESDQAHSFLNNMVNYLEKRMETLKAQIDEAKIFSSENVYYELKARLNELEALIGEQSLDIVV